MASKSTKAKPKAKAAAPTPDVEEVVDADTFLQRMRNLRSVRRTIPGIGTVVLRKLTLDEYDECGELAIIRDAEGNPVKDESGNTRVDPDLRSTLLFIAQIAEPKLTLEQVGDIGKFDVDAYLQLRGAMAELGVRQEDAEARFPSGAGEDGEVPAG